jgi:hypothetical protein
MVELMRSRKTRSRRRRTIRDADGNSEARSHFVWIYFKEDQSKRKAKRKRQQCSLSLQQRRKRKEEKTATLAKFAAKKSKYESCRARSDDQNKQSRHCGRVWHRQTPAAAVARALIASCCRPVGSFGTKTASVLRK